MFAVTNFTLRNETTEDAFLCRNLDNNLFVCDCNISWFLDAINTDNRHRILNLENLTCCWPGNHRKQYLVQLSREDVCLTTTERAPSVKTVNVSTTMKPNASESGINKVTATRGTRNSFTL